MRGEEWLHFDEHQWFNAFSTTYHQQKYQMQSSKPGVKADNHTLHPLQACVIVVDLSQG